MLPLVPQPNIRIWISCSNWCRSPHTQSTLLYSPRNSQWICANIANMDSHHRMQTESGVYVNNCKVGCKVNAPQLGPAHASCWARSKTAFDSSPAMTHDYRRQAAQASTPQAGIQRQVGSFMADVSDADSEHAQGTSQASVTWSI